MNYSIETSNNQLSFIVFGTGAIGTYIGGSLLLSGHQVAFIDRKKTVEYVRERGLRLQIAGKDHFVPNPDIFTDLESALLAGKYDVAIVAVKSFDTLGLAQTIARVNSGLSVVLSIQNGVENERLLATHLGSSKVLAGTLTSAVRRIDAGNIVLERLRGMGIALDHPLAWSIVEAFNRAELNARSYENAQSMKWSKMLTNLLANSTSAILDMTPAEIFAHPELYMLEVRQIRESLNVMDGLGLPVTNLPGTPIRLLAFIMRNLPERLSQPIAKRALGRGRGGKMPSFHIDLYAGKTKSEVDYLNGAVVRYAEQLGIEVPVNKMLNETLLSLLSRKHAIEDFAKQPGKLLALLKTNSNQHR